MKLNIHERTGGKARFTGHTVKGLATKLAACAGAIFYALPHAPTLAQAPCTECPTAANIPDLGPGWQFPQNSDITVWVSGAFPEPMFGCIRQAFVNWQNNFGTGSGIRYSFSYGGSSPTGNNVITVNRSAGQIDVRDPDGNLTQAQATITPVFNSPTNPTHLNSAHILVDSRVDNCTAMTSAIAHETGHTYRLDDCRNCCPHSSTMAGYNSFNDVNSGTTSPSGCDAAIVRQYTNYNTGTARGPEPRLNSGGSYGGGANGYNYNGYYNTQACYAVVMVTCYYSCGSSGCTFMSCTANYLGTTCF